MKRLSIWLMLLLAAVMLTACHVDNDPWPIGEELAFVTPTPLPTVAQVPAATEQPITSPATTAEPAVIQLPTHTPEPGLNG